MNILAALIHFGEQVFSEFTQSGEGVAVKTDLSNLEADTVEAAQSSIKTLGHNLITAGLTKLGVAEGSDLATAAEAISDEWAATAMASLSSHLKAAGINIG